MDMTPPIRIDEATGLKLFNTRAAKATEKIAGKGYSPVSDESLKVLPAPMAVMAARLRRATCAVSASDAVGALTPLPMARSTLRMAAIMAASSPGSSDAR